MIVKVHVTRQPNDRVVGVSTEGNAVGMFEMDVLRASIGGNPEVGFYLQFRGDPFAVLEMLERVLAVAREALPLGSFKDES